MEWLPLIRPRFNLISLLMTISMIDCFSAHLTSRPVERIPLQFQQSNFDRSMDELLDKARLQRFVRESTQQFAMD